MRVHENIQAADEPPKNLSVDEGMIASKGRLSFRQHMPAKPTKYGIKLWLAGDSANGCGKLLCLPWEKQRSCKQPWFWCCHKHGSSIFLTNTDISFDNFFMGIALMDYLLAHNIYAWGTVQVKRKGSLPCAKKKLKQGEMVQAQCGHLLFTKWHEERDVSFVSTISCQLHQHDLCNARRTAAKLQLKNILLWTCTQQTWEE